MPRFPTSTVCIISIVLCSVGLMTMLSTASHAADVSVRDIVIALTETTEENPIDLRGKDLSDLDLSNLDLKAAHLETSNLFGANLSSSDLSYGRLAQANLDRTQLTMADFTKADLRGASILIPAIHNSLTSNIWNAPTFRESNLAGARLSGNFDGTDFGAASLANVTFGVHSSLIRCEFSGSDLQGAQFDRAQLTYARFVQADLRGSSFRDAKLIWVDFTDADLRGADLRGADLSMAILDGAKLGHAKLDGAVGLESARGLSIQ